MSAFQGRLERYDQMLGMQGAESPPDPSPTLGEIWDAGWGFNEREEHSDSRAQNWKLATAGRDASLDQWVEAGLADGTLESQDLEPFIEGVVGYRPVESQRLTEQSADVRYKYDELSDYAQKHGWKGRGTLEIEQDLRQSLSEQRQRDLGVLGRAEGFWGKATAFASMGASSMTDPLNILATFAPMGGAKHIKGFIDGVKKVGGTAAATNIGVEAALQSVVMDYKEDIASPYDWTDAVFNIGMAGAMGGLIGGVAGGLTGILNNPRSFDDVLEAARTELADVVPDKSRELSDAEAYELLRLRELGGDDARMAELEKKEAYSQSLYKKAQLDAIAERPRFTPITDEVTPDDYARLDQQVADIDDFEFVLDDGTKVSSKAYAGEYDDIAAKLKELEVCMYGG